MTPHADSLKKRYLYKLGSKIIIIPLGFITSTLTARSLGAEAYGNFNFITSFFTSLFAFADTGTSTSFYTKYSQRPNDIKLVKFYWLFVAVLSLAIVTIVATTVAFDYNEKLWVGVAPLYVFLALFWGLLFWINQIIVRITDARGLSVKGEITNIFQKTFGTSLLIILFIAQTINLFTLFIYHISMLILLAVLWARMLRRNEINLFPSVKLEREVIKHYAKELYDFSSPLIVIGLFVFIIGFADRWLLQVFGGSSEQGYYSLALKIASICFMFTKSMSPLFQRELALFHSVGKNPEMGKLFLRVVPILFSISALICFFVALQAEKISLIMGGDDFVNAKYSVAIMALYPIHQTYGQLNSAVFFASGSTKLYRNINIVNLFIGLSLTLLFISPREYYGLQMGSFGMALKMFLAQIIGQNIMLWYSAKLLRISFMRLFTQQVISIVVIGSIAGTTIIGANYISSNPILSISLSLVLYLSAISGLIYLFPSLFSINQNDKARLLAFARQRLFHIK
jgi:O-antigen/teichoic acid export membrane protein